MRWPLAKYPLTMTFSSVHCERRPIKMLWLIALAVIAFIALAVLGLVLHLLFSPWLLVVIIGVLAWIKLRPRRPPQQGR